MDQYVDNRQKEILWDLLANPADNGASYIHSLERLVKDYPQSGLLQVLRARMGDRQELNKAAVYFNPRTLHKLVNHPEDIAVVDADRIIAQPEDAISESQNFFSIDEEVETVAVLNNTPEPLIDTTDEYNNQHDAPADAEQPAVVAAIAEDVVEEIAEASPVTEEYINTDLVFEPENEITEDVVEEIAEAPQVTEEYVNTDHVSEPENEIAEDAVEEIAEAPQVAAETETVETKTEAGPVAEPPAEAEFIEPPAPQIANTYGSRFPKPQPPVTSTPEPEPEQPQSNIEDDVYDEIVGIEDIGFEAVSNEQPEAATPITEARFSVHEAEAEPEEEETSEVLFHQPQPVVEPLQDEHAKTIDEEERLIFGGIVNADYLSFDKKIDELRGINIPAQPQQNTPVETTPAAPEPQTQLTAAQPVLDKQGVSFYDDDKMPYSFMWWLKKTRKEYADNLRPYATDNIDAAKNKAAKMGTSNELQQQYYENIFSLTSVSGVERETDPANVAFDPNKKEDVIIERFIHTEPQIKPLSADKLDNENKAKKSSEDLNDFVTETLARIYTDQMLYHKAIATYKKLILKFPEKKLYFAAQIELLEKKTN